MIIQTTPAAAQTLGSKPDILEEKNTTALIQSHLLTGGGALRDYFITFENQKVDLSSLVFLSLTAAVFRGGDRRRRLFAPCTVDCWHELEEKCALLHEHNDAERRGGTDEREPESGVSAELS